jgi:hypothetical protein
LRDLTYSVTDVFKYIMGVKVYRIRALVDIPQINIRKGDFGGWVDGDFQGKINTWEDWIDDFTIVLSSSSLEQVRKYDYFKKQDIWSRNFIWLQS